MRTAAPPLFLPLAAWGERCRVRATDVCLASLLAPMNVPLVAKERRVVLQVYTTARDWTDHLREHWTVHRMRGIGVVVEPILFDLEPGENNHVRMSKGYKAMLPIAEMARAIAVPVFADSLVANGGLRDLLRLADGRRRIVMTIGLRGELDAFDDALSFGLDVVSIEPRDMARLLVNNLHSEIRAWSAEEPACGSHFVATPWWRAGQDAILVHSIYWEPTLIDFSHPWPHDTRALDLWTLDGHYAWSNAGDDPRAVHAIGDSDVFLHLTMTSEAEYRVNPSPIGRPVEVAVREARGHPSTDPLRWRLFEIPVRVHGGDWLHGIGSFAKAERKARELVESTRVPMREGYDLESPHTQAIVLLESRGVHNLVRYRGKIWRVPQALGELHLDRDADRAKPGIAAFDTIEAARAACR